MSTVSYSNYTMRAKSSWTISYNCEVCGHQNVSVEPINTSEVTSKYLDNRKYQKNNYSLTKDEMLQMAKNAVKRNKKIVESYKSSIEKGDFKKYPRIECKNCGSYQSFMKHSGVIAKFIIWLIPALLFLVEAIVFLLNAIGLINTVGDTTGMSFFTAGFAFLVCIVCLIFVLRNLKKVKENKKLESRENKAVPKSCFEPTYLITVDNKKISLEDYENALNSYLF